MKKEKSKQIIIFSILFIFFGLRGILQLIINIQLGLRAIEKLGMLNAFIMPTLLGNARIWILPIIYSILGIASIGIFKLKLWARKISLFLFPLIIIFYIIFIPISINAALKFETTFTKRGMIALVEDSLFMFSIIVLFSYAIYYFSRPNIKEQFKY